MWFSSAFKVKPAPIANFGRNRFRPRLEALEDRRLLSAGALDATFGGSLAGSASSAGTVLGPSGISINNPSNAIVVYPNSGANPATDGKIVVGGSMSVATNRHSTATGFALARYNPDGSPDATFGAQGVVATLIGTSASISGLVRQSDGKLIAVGLEDDGSQFNWVIARYTTTGQLDATFGSSGVVVTHLFAPGSNSSGGEQAASAVAVQGDGSNTKIYVCGGVSFSRRKGKTATSGADMAVARYNVNGSLDTTFASGGIAVTPNVAYGGATGNWAFTLAIQVDGKVVVAGETSNTSSSAMLAARYMTAGVLDSTFGGGVVTLGGNSSEAGAFGALVQSNGAIVLSGYSHIGGVEKQTHARLTSTGLFDTTFGASGYAVNGNMLNGHNIIQAANGDLLTAGTVGPSTFNAADDFGVAAHLPNGILDTTFGSSGTSVAAITTGLDRSEMLGLQSDGKIVAGGVSINATTSASSVALARFLPPSTKISSITAGQITAGDPVTVTASNILNSNPATYIAQVAFYYLDSNNIVVTLGTVTSQSTQTSYNLSANLAPRSYTLYAVATDSNGVLSDPLAISFIVL